MQNILTKFLNLNRVNILNHTKMRLFFQVINKDQLASLKLGRNIYFPSFVLEHSFCKEPAPMNK